MPPSTRRQAREQRLSEASAEVFSETLPQDFQRHHVGEEADEEELAEEDGGGDVEEDDEDDEMQEAIQQQQQQQEQQEEDDEEEQEEDSQSQDPTTHPFPPPGLKEISSLASWTVSTAKPGNGVLALRSPSLSHFWQSDGPQPHLLSLHFFKLVSIAAIRVFLDFESDESYTPTKIQFLAGMGAHDVLEFAEMAFEQPTGWVDVDFENVGVMAEEDGDGQEDGGEEGGKEVDWSKRPVLRAMVLQVRILENHQNGKDTHLRAVQVFARDEQVVGGVGRRADALVERGGKTLPVRSVGGKGRPREVNNIRLAEFMLEPELR